MNATIDVVVSGHLTIDLLPRMETVGLRELPSPGHLFETGPMDYSTGGAVSNTGLALHRLGVDVRLMGTVGEDILGQAVISLLDARDPILSQFVRRSDQPSSYTIVLSPERVDRIFLHYPGPNDTFDATYVDFEQVAHARIFHLGYPVLMGRLMADDGLEVEKIYRRAKATGVVTSLDTALPDPTGISGQVNWRKLISRTLPYTDIFVPSIEEILFMLRRNDFDAWHGDVLSHLTADYLADLADELLAMGAVVAGFKMGEMGIYLQTGSASKFERLSRLPIDMAQWANHRVWKPAFEVEVVGTTGAGDSAYAGLLTAMLKGLPPDEAVTWACAVGACNVEAPDATSGIRTWEATAERLQSGWRQRDIVLAGYG
ncbi:MAG: carbohydrate kinase family protein [Phototrophicales bacterium]|nr:MAG: carbohydrate kinase family protein [Phototrophicales bacterium]